MSILTLYHTGFEKIRRPDVHYDRKNADFGQGFYLSSGEVESFREEVRVEEKEYQDKFFDIINSME